MLADFYIPRLSNNIKIAVQKNNLLGQIWYRSLDHVKKNGVSALLTHLYRVQDNDIQALDCVKSERADPKLGEMVGSYNVEFVSMITRWVQMESPIVTVSKLTFFQFF